MTNGEKLQSILDVDRDCVEVHGENGTMTFTVTQDWWNAEYKEPTTKNDLALIHTWGLDEEIRCTMCTNSMKSDRGCDGSCVVNKGMYKAVMDAIEKRIQPTTKNNLGVDAVSRKAVDDALYDFWHDVNIVDDSGLGIYQDSIDVINELPSVTPQLSSELEKNSKKLEKNSGELDCISREKAIAWAEYYIAVYDAKTANESIMGMLRDLPSVPPQDIDYKAQYERLAQKAEIVISQLRADRDRLMSLPPATPIRPKGHWICDGKGRCFADYHCSECGLKLALCGQDIKQRQDSGYSLFCGGCGADMREVVEE